MSECADCGKRIGPKTKTGKCRSCFTIGMNADPAFQERRAAAIRRKMQEPLHRAKMAAVIKRNAAAWHATPEGRKWLEDHGKRLATEVLRRPDVMAKATSPEARAKAAKTKHETYFGWCPLEYREELIWLMRSKRLSSADARQLIEIQIAADKERAESRLSPFDRQMRALQNGAKLVANDRKPMFGEALRA